jgi:transcriptional regulator with XRE-family HTH domain
MKSTFTQSYTLFRNLLVQTRKDKKVTQVQLAQRLGKPQSFVTKYELGERRLDLIEFLEIASALNANPLSFINKLQKQMRSVEK